MQANYKHNNDLDNNINNYTYKTGLQIQNQGMGIFTACQLSLEANHTYLCLGFGEANSSLQEYMGIQIVSDKQNTLGSNCNRCFLNAGGGVSCWCIIRSIEEECIASLNITTYSNTNFTIDGYLVAIKLN